MPPKEGIVEMLWIMGYTFAMEIKPYEKNAKKHPKKQIAQIAASIKEFGFNQPVVIDKKGVIIVGHGRYEAAKSLGMKNEDIPVIIAELNEEQAKAYRLADNKLNESEWDMNLVIEELKGLSIPMIDLTGFDKDLIIEPEERDDVVPAVPEEPVSKLGDIYQLGEHRVMCGDSTKLEDVEQLMNGELAEMTWTDPPYNVDYEGKTRDALKIDNDKMPDDVFFQFLLSFYDATMKIMHNGSPIYVAHADSQGINFRKALKDAGFELKQCIIWVKNTMVLGRQDYQWQHEPILYGWKPGAAHRWYGMFDKTTVIDDEVDIKKLKKEELQALVTHLRNERKTTIIRHDKPSRSSDHPTMKPVGLITKFLFNSSQKRDIIYDGFLGSGSTLIAAEKTERICYGMELDPKYVDVIIKRWEDYTNQEAVKLK